MYRAISKILIANRGEIAVRISRTARALDIFTTGIYSSADPDPVWTEFCNDSFCIKGNSLKDTYLDVNKIIAIAKETGCNAIHPGYGFLSENPHFAAACENNGLVFIGPSARILELAGDKQVSHSFVKELGIPVTEQISGESSYLLSMKKEFTYPLLVKAVAGGGGKGMRLVKSGDMLASALEIASDEAFQYFGDSRICIETYLKDVRHIEIQIFGDKQGHVRHLFERECSIQRRHQKIIEESPSVFLSDHTRQMLSEAAVAIGKALNYENAGTVEFLVEPDGHFRFLEINPRLQVEHGVTELVTGIDLVREQIRIAEGHPLSFANHSVEVRVHAMEARIYAEDPENDLLPSPGTIHTFSPPEMKEIRIDTAMKNGSVVSTSFDPLIAKILAVSPSREQTIIKMKQAVKEFVISGIPNNLPLIDAILLENDFLANHISTRFLEKKQRHIEETIATRRNSIDNNLLAVTAAVYSLFQPRASNSPWKNGFWRSSRQIRFRIRDETIELNYVFAENKMVVFYCPQSSFMVSEVNLSRGLLEFNLDGRFMRFFFHQEDNGILGFSDGQMEYRVMCFIPSNSQYHIISGEELDYSRDTIIAPQPGTISEIKVAEGQHVSRGDILLTVESMKLENSIVAESAAFIKKIIVSAGDSVKKDEPLIYLQPIINNKDQTDASITYTTA